MRRIRIHYLFALGTLALLNLGSLLLVQGMFSAAQLDSTHFNVAGRQRMLSQRIAKASLVVQQSNDAEAQSELRSALRDFEATHEMLVHSTPQGHPVHSNLEGLEDEFRQLLGSGRRVLDGDLGEEAARVQAAAAAFLPKMRLAVQVYGEESQAAAARVRAKEFALLIATLLVLIAEGIVVFEPLCRKIGRDQAALKAGRDEALASAEARKRFLATVSHEIRTPLHGVIGTSSLLLQSELTQEQVSLAQAGKRSAENLLEMLNGVLDHAKLQEGAVALESAPFSMKDLIEDVDLMHHSPYCRPSVELVVEAAEDVPAWLLGDATRIRQVLLNLVSNGLKFTSEGEVRVTLGWEKSSAGMMFVATVADTGIGIPADRLESIFQEYTQAEVSTTRKYGGTGLGLAISRELTELMGGSLELTSVAGEGSRFSMRLPAEACAEPAEPGSPVQATDARPRASLRVLAADDDEVNRRVLGAHLGAMDISYILVENGVEVVDAAGREAYDVLLIDLNMPIMGGLEAARAVRADSISSDALIVAVTGETGEEAELRCVEAGFDRVLSKPFQRAELEAVLATRRPLGAAHDAAA